MWNLEIIEQKVRNSLIEFQALIKWGFIGFIKCEVVII